MDFSVYSYGKKPERTFWPTQYNATGFCPLRPPQRACKVRTQLKSTRAALGERDTCSSGGGKEFNPSSLSWPGCPLWKSGIPFTDADAQHRKHGETPPVGQGFYGHVRWEEGRAKNGKQGSLTDGLGAVATCTQSLWGSIWPWAPLFRDTSGG